MCSIAFPPVADKLQSAWLLKSRIANCFGLWLCAYVVELDIYPLIVSYELNKIHWKDVIVPFVLLDRLVLIKSDDVNMNSYRTWHPNLF